MEPLGENERCAVYLVDPPKNSCGCGIVGEPSDQVWSNREHELASVAVELEHPKVTHTQTRPQVEIVEIKR